MTDLVAIGNYYSRMDAEIARGILTSGGIASYIDATDLGSANPALLLGAGGVRLIVQADDAETAARLLLSAQQDGEALIEGEPPGD